MAAANQSDFIYSLDGLKALKAKAMDKADQANDLGKQGTCTYLYRNKFKDYFQTIDEQEGRLMTMYPKDTGKVCYGDKYSPINRDDENKRPKGLFFCANLDMNDEPVPRSPFGDTRFTINIREVIKDHVKMYFADFYCPHGGEQPNKHYVTIILADEGSALDEICQQYLVLLDKHDGSDNPFLYFDNNEKAWKVTKKVWVEILATRDISLDEGNVNYEFDGYKKVALTGKGHKGSCNICRLNEPFDQESNFWTETPEDLSFSVSAEEPREDE